MDVFEVVVRVWRLWQRCGNAALRCVGTTLAHGCAMPHAAKSHLRAAALENKDFWCLSMILGLSKLRHKARSAGLDEKEAV